MTNTEPDTGTLDPAKIGAVLLTATLISWHLGHAIVQGTVRDYLAPHGYPDAEHEFVYRVLMGDSPRDLISAEDAARWLQSRDLPSIGDPEHA